MGKVRRVYTRCPMCQYIFRAPRVGTYVTVGREPDLCPKFPGRQSDGARLIQSEVTMCPACSFAAREVCGQERSLSARELGDLCLRASWVCRKEKEPPFESTFQLRAVRYFLRALKEDALAGRELSVTTYLVGELNRRLGNHREALNWYVNAARTTGGDPSLGWLDRLIEKQSKLAEEQAA